jgi:muramidase (phage lysozyme)
MSLLNTSNSIFTLSFLEKRKCYLDFMGGFGENQNSGDRRDKKDKKREKDKSESVESVDQQQENGEGVADTRKEKTKREWDYYEQSLLDNGVVPLKGGGYVNLPKSERAQQEAQKRGLSPETARVFALLPQREQREVFWQRYFPRGGEFVDTPKQINQILKKIDSFPLKQFAEFESWLLMGQQKEREAKRSNSGEDFRSSRTEMDASLGSVSRKGMENIYSPSKEFAATQEEFQEVFSQSFSQYEAQMNALKMTKENLFIVFSRFFSAIVTQESGGDYNVRGSVIKKGTHAGTRAIGRYQIMPKNWDAWSKEYAGRVFPITPKNQDMLAAFKLSQYFCENFVLTNGNISDTIKLTAVNWYGNMGMPKPRSTAEISPQSPGNGPSPLEYAESVSRHFDNTA